MAKKWIYDKIKSEEFFKLKSELNLPHAFIIALLRRGIKNYDQAKLFFRPRIEDCDDPFIFKGMAKAVERLEKAISKNEKILLYGDYDVDGTTSVSLLYIFLKKLTQNIYYYTPNRHTEGYGLSKQAINNISQEQYKLLIVLDCGTTNIQEIDLANILNIDAVIIDHHIPKKILPRALALINPKQEDCPYPFKEFASCGLVFKFVQAFANKNNIHFNNYKALLEFVAIGTIADLVPLTSENRILVSLGLQVLNTSPCVATSAITKIINYKKTYKARDVAFKLGPLINAAGRIDHASKIIDLLTEQNIKKAEFLSEKIHQNNLLRREYEKKATQEALELLRNNPKTASSVANILYKSYWHAGIIGIVASKIQEHYYRPTIILTKVGNLITGSARSVGSFNIYEAIDNCKELLEQYGGHKYAAGMKLKPENLDAFIAKLGKIISDTFTEDCRNPIKIDAVISLRCLNKKFINLLEEFEPSGKGNNRITFATKGVRICSPITLINGSHLKFQVDDKNTTMECIGFNFGNLYGQVHEHSRITICYHVDINKWNKQQQIQLIIKDIKISGASKITHAHARLYNTSNQA